MKKLLFILMSVLAFLGWSTVCAQTDLFFSEYIEGTKGNNKALEIFNGTGADVDLSAYTVKQDNNGKGWKFDFTLSGTLKKGTALVLLHNESDASLLAAYPDAVLPTTYLMGFNGNDAIGLFKGEELIDIIGVFGSSEDYGKDVDMKRKCDATAPSDTYNVADWDVTALTAGAFVLSEYEGLGTHCGSNPAEDETAPKVDKILTKSNVPTSIEVYFNEAVTKASAEAVANYRIEGLAVTAAALAEGDKMVTLTTAAMTAGTEYTLVINGVEDAAGNKMENVSTKFSFGYAEVADLAALCAMRETYVEGQKYLVKGELVITAIVGKNGSNQTTTNAWVQDKGCDKAVGHSMMLYYVNNLFPETAKIGDVISGLVGELTVYNDLIEMQYFDTTMIEFTGETAEVTIDNVTISELKGSNKLQYQNAMVQIKGVEFADAGDNFAENKSYNISDGNSTIVLRTNREGSYLGEKIPLNKTDVRGYVGYYSGSCQISPRTKEDIGVLGGVANENRSNIEYAVYPNPTSGILNVEVAGDFRVAVYNLNGVQLMRRAATDKVQADLSKLVQGVYVVEISTEKGTVYTKVVVR